MSGMTIRTRNRFTILALLLIPASGWSQTQTDSPGSGEPTQETIPELVQQIRQLQQQDRDLQERIRILEGRQAQAAPATVANAYGSTRTPEAPTA